MCVFFSMNPNQLWFLAMLVLVVVLLSIVYIEHDDVVGRALLVSVLMAMVLQRVIVLNGMVVLLLWFG